MYDDSKPIAGNTHCITVRDMIDYVYMNLTAPMICLTTNHGTIGALGTRFPSGDSLSHGIAMNNDRLTDRNDIGVIPFSSFTPYLYPTSADNTTFPCAWSTTPGRLTTSTRVRPTKSGVSRFHSGIAGGSLPLAEEEVDCCCCSRRLRAIAPISSVSTAPG